MTKGRVPYEILEHTADVGVVVRAPALDVLFERAASAMFDQIADVTRVAGGPLVHDVVIDAADRESLLVAWLSELASWASAEGALFSAFDVKIEGETGLVGRAWGEPADMIRHAFETEIKAVTYHELSVTHEEASGEWRARVLFDV